MTAADETAIAYAGRGEGPPVILMHGSGVDHRVWDDVIPALAERFTVYAVDRGGRGGSGDADDYDIDREFDDLVAVTEAIDGAVLETYWLELRGEPERFERFRSRPDYERRLDAAHTLPREMGGRRAFRPTPETYPDVDVPTLLLTGSESHQMMRESVAVTAELFPESETVRMDGEGHAAMNTAPERFVTEVLKFLDGD